MNAPQRAVEFQAWRIPPGEPAYDYPLQIEDAIDLKTAMIFACDSYLAHKDHLLIQRVDHAHGQHRAFLFRIVKLAARWVGGERIEPLQPREVAQWPVAEPIKMLCPPDVIADPVGIDRTLIEVNH
jgi:hypothetical protein